MRNRIASLVLAALAAFSVGCNGGASGTGSPTGPGSVVRLTFTATTTSSHTIRTARLLMDGREVTSVVSPGGSGQVFLDSTVRGIARGEHTISVVIADQASSPNPYTVGGAVTLPDRILDLAPREGLLATGEALTFRISV